MKCPKCGYVRSQSDAAPAGECPSCGIIYSKFDPSAEKRRAELASNAARRAARAPQPAVAAEGRSTVKLKRAVPWVAGVVVVFALAFAMLGGEALWITLLFGAMFAALCGLFWLIAVSGRRRAVMAAKDAALLDQSPLMHCMSCGTEFRKPIKGPLRGSDGVEIALWLFAFWAFVPVVYSIWRRSSKTFRPACPACGSGEVVPEGTPGAQAHKRQLAA